MELTKLFKLQKVLRDRINYNEPDRFNKLILALLVELGECANEQRSWKFWSKDQEPRIKVPTTAWGEPYKNPLLEEYVDGLHFVLEIGLDLGFQNEKPFIVHIEKIEKMFLKAYTLALQLRQCGNSHKSFYYGKLLSNYLGLGKSLGFTQEQIEQAYISKNEINHERQNNGY